MSRLSEIRKNKRNEIIIELFRKGEKMETILEKANCSRTTVYRITSDEDVEIRMKNKPHQPYIGNVPTDIKQAIVSDYMDGNITSKDIAAKYGISRPTLYRILNSWKEEE